MSAYVGPVRRKETKKGHHYIDANGTRVQGVTTVTDGGLPKKAILAWGPRVTAEYAVDHWDELSAMSPSKRQKELESARWKDTDAAKDKGTLVHDVAQRLLADEEVEVSDEIAGHVESYIAFLRDFQVEPVLVERPVMSHQHGYAGTFDLIADLVIPDRGVVRALIDLKTSRSGIFGEIALQLAGYRYADVYLDEDGVEQPMPEVEDTFGLHIRADDYDLYPVQAERVQHRQLLYVREVARFDKDSRELIGDAMPHPSRVRRRRLEIVKEND